MFTMNYGQVYYLGVVVGPKNGSNLVDYDAGCVHILEAQPVIWYDQPFPPGGIIDVRGVVVHRQPADRINDCDVQKTVVPGRNTIPVDVAIVKLPLAHFAVR